MSRDLLSHYERQGITLWLQGARLRFKSAAPLTPEQVAELSAHKEKIVTTLKETPETPAEGQEVPPEQQKKPGVSWVETPGKHPANTHETPVKTQQGEGARLPWQLERLISAASSDNLPKGMVTLAPGHMVPDLGRYTLAWAASYLTGDRDEALARLWTAYRAWQERAPSGVNHHESEQAA